MHRGGRRALLETARRRAPEQRSPRLKTGLEVVGAFADAEAALAAAPSLKPQVALLDIDLGGALNGVDLGLLLRRQLPNLGIVLLSNYEDPQVLSAVPKGAAAGQSH